MNRNVIRAHGRVELECSGDLHGNCGVRNRDEVEAWFRWTGFEPQGLVVDEVTRVPDGWTRERCWAYCPSCSARRRKQHEIMRLQEELKR